MDNVGNLLGDLSSGDRVLTAPSLEAHSVMKRDQDSTDDFEHLDRENKQEEVGESPLHHAGACVATQNFLDMERDEFVDSQRPPSVSDKLIDHLADKMTDSESDADPTSESPLHSAMNPKTKPPSPTATPDITPSPAVSTTPVYIKPVSEPAIEPFTEIATSSPKPAPSAKEIPEPPVATVPLPKPEPIFVSEPVASQKKEAPKSEPASQPVSLKPKIEDTRTTMHVIEAEVIFCKMGLDAWFDPQRLHPKVESLIYWRDVPRSGIALGAGLAVLIALACCSVVSVLAYAALLMLSAAVAFRVYRNVLQAVQKTNDGHPFKWMLEKDISVPAERAQSLAAAATAHLNAATAELRRLFLVEDLVDSLKFGVLLWCLTYVGACFNGITLIILAWIALFTLPKAYEMNKAQVDANLELARAKINEISAKVRAAVPLGRKSESEKDK